MTEQMVKGAVHPSELEDGELSGAETSASQIQTKNTKQRRSRIGDLEKVVSKNYNELTEKFDRMFNLLNEKLTQSHVSNKSSANGSQNDRNDDELSICPREEEQQFSDVENSENEFDNSVSYKRTNLSEKTRHCLHEIFQDDALLKKPEEKLGIEIEDSQKEILSQSYRAKKPNDVTAYSEEYKGMFPSLPETEDFLKVPPLDDIVDECLKRQHGSRCGSFAKRGRALFSQPDKMVEKTAFRGHHAANMGIMMNLYMQQALGMLLNMLETEDISQIEKKVRDIFSLCTKSLDQLGRVGAFFHIIRRQVTMHDTGLFKLDSSTDISSMPLTGEGVLGHGLDDILKERKEVKKTLDELLPESKSRKFLKRKSASSEGDSSTTPAKMMCDKPASGYNGQKSRDNFRIPKINDRNKPEGSGSRSFETKSYTSKQPYKSAGRGRGVHTKSGKQ
ncbi:uncharacterized protein LOC132727761 [Ruditapes philippinarum]|uniref:uncharacterized protein LOC132727761 n=1 Tax=Ruditapes philippinarum TaxID=129788 RepID=UPI00295C1BD8|nr:uncharacterized protein LOC132727761 [Ruditapes philippinarum]